MTMPRRAWIAATLLAKSDPSKAPPRQPVPTLQDCPECEAPAGLPCRAQEGVMVFEHQARHDLAGKAATLSPG
jgi:hypothetical protein